MTVQTLVCFATQNNMPLWRRQSQMTILAGKAYLPADDSPRHNPAGMHILAGFLCFSPVDPAGPQVMADASKSWRDDVSAFFARRF